MKTYKVDLDYEASLFDPHYSADSKASKKIIREFEYVFFLIEKENCALKNVKDYEKNYLDHLRSLGFKLPSFCPNANEYENWWGHHHNRSREKLLNSKLTSARLAQKKHWGFHQGAIVENMADVKNHLARFGEVEKWMIKRPHSFSGIGHYYFRVSSLDETVFSKILTEPCLLEPVFDRVFDIGTTFLISDSKIQKHFMVENFNSESGRFSGGAGSSDVDKFKKYIWDKYQFDLRELEKISTEIAREYLQMGAVSNVQIDSFVYKEKGELHLYPLVEVNYRKTMGLVIQALADKFPEASHVEWKIEVAKASQLIHDVSWTKLSPEGNHFHSFVKAF